jgi:glycosyltransferase involved in cell wall biosynthesis
MIWAIVSGEYPPKPGGVADYTAQLASALAAAGDTVHVWFPALEETGPSALSAPAGVHLHPLPDRFGPAALRQLDTGLACLRRQHCLLVQYVPHAFGFKAMNLPFCYWLYHRRRRERIWVMFHEVAFPFAIGQPVRHNLLAVVTRVMAALAARSAERCFASIPGWIPLLQRLRGRSDGIDWLPVPSNLPTTADPDAVAAVRRRYVPNADQLLIGHFGSHGGLITPLLAQVLPHLLANDTCRVGLLIGRRGEVVRDRLATENPWLGGRLFATGELPRPVLAAHIAACDLLVQPYPDGMSSRRTSAMAGLALGVPTATTAGRLSEPLWTRDGLVALAPVDNPVSLTARCETLLRNPKDRYRLATRCRQAYREHFGISHTVDRLRANGRH